MFFRPGWRNKVNNLPWSAAMEAKIQKTRRMMGAIPLQARERS